MRQTANGQVRSWLVFVASKEISHGLQSSDCGVETVLQMEAMMKRCRCTRSSQPYVTVLTPAAAALRQRRSAVNGLECSSTSCCDNSHDLWLHYRWTRSTSLWGGESRAPSHQWWPTSACVQGRPAPCCMPRCWHIPVFSAFNPFRPSVLYIHLYSSKKR